MNRILFHPDELRPDGRVRLTDHRAVHIRDVLKSQSGNVIRTGEINGLVGTSQIEHICEGGEITLVPTHQDVAQEPWFDLILAIPRPRAMKRLWPQLAALGVGRIVILNAAKVEKCYFSSQWVEPFRYNPLLIEGLMQAGTTRLPEVLIRKRLKHFLKDELETLFANAPRLLAHPEGCECVGALPVADAAFFSSMRPSTRPVLAIGPEGGWTDDELTLFEAHGFHCFSIGSRILRTDTATIALIAVLWERQKP
jgi:RsmE family RNA methyltransferase